MPPSATPLIGWRSRPEDRSRSETTTRVDLLENLLAHRREGTPLLVPLISTGAFMRVLGAIAAAEEPVRIDPRALTWEGEGRTGGPSSTTSSTGYGSRH